MAPAKGIRAPPGTCSSFLLPLLMCFCCYGNLKFPLACSGKNENWHLLLSHCRYFGKSFSEMFVFWHNFFRNVCWIVLHQACKCCTNSPFWFLCLQLRRSWGDILVWACPLVCPSVCASITLAYGQEQLEIGSWNLICEITMKFKRTRIFFSFPSDLSYQRHLHALFRCFFRLSRCKPVEPCEQNILRTAWAGIMIFGSQIVSIV